VSTVLEALGWLTAYTLTVGAALARIGWVHHKPRPTPPEKP
jgi:hypothetical protein